MAMNVKFLRGVVANYNSLAEKNADTLYFCTDGALYLGTNKIADVTNLTEVNAAIKALQDAGYQNAEQVGAAITAALTPYAKTADIQGSLDKAESALQAADLADYAKTADVVAKTTYETHLTAQGEKDAAQDAAIKAIADDYLKVSDKTELEGKIEDAEEAAKTYTNDEIIGLEFALSEDGKTLELKNKAGTAVATLDTTDFVVDGMLTSVVADQANNKLTFTWNTVSGIEATEIELSSIADIYKGNEGEEVKVAVSNENVISATLTDSVKSNIAKGVEAQGWGNHANEGYLKAADISGKEDKANLKALAYKDIAEKSDLATDVQASLDKADTALQAHQDISHLATKQEVTDGLALKTDKATYEAYVEAHKDDYTNTKVDELVASATDKAQTAQNEVDALEQVVAQNAQTCQSNFNTISEQLTWGSF